MKKNALLLGLLGMLMIETGIKAQLPAPPPEIDNNTKFSKYNKKVKEYLEWYIKAPVDKDTAFRRKVASFIVTWVTGSEDVSVNIGSSAMPIIEEKGDPYSKDLLVAYIGGMAVYELDNSKDKSEINIEMAGLKTIVKMGKNNGSLLASSEAFKKFSAMDDATLKKYVKDCLAEDKNTKKE